MYKGNRIGVVIPTHNEEKFVGDVLDAVPEFVDRVYAVDDCSDDGTWDVIQQRAAAPLAAETAEPAPRVESTTDGGRPLGTRISPIRHEVNRGRGGAIKTGYTAALEDDMDVVAVIDGDGQMDPSLLDMLLDPIVSGKADYAKGDRLETTELRDEMPAWRLFGNFLLTVLTRTASGYWGMSDPQNGYTAISRDALERIDVDSLHNDFGFLNDILVHLNVHGARIVDVPMPAVYGDEESGIEYKSFVPSLSFLLLSGFLWRLRSEYATPDLAPAAVPYGLSVVTGTAVLGYVGQSLMIAGEGPNWAASIAAVALCSTFVLVAVLLERRDNRDLEFDLDSDLPVDDRT